MRYFTLHIGGKSSGKIRYFFRKNKERVVFRWNKLIFRLRGYIIDLKCILFVPQLSRFIDSMLKSDENILTIGICREGGIGDRMTLGAFAIAVKRKFPNSFITAIVNNSIEPLTRHDAINKVKLCKPVHWDKIAKYNGHRYDIVYLIHRYVSKVIINKDDLNNYKKNVDKIFSRYSNIYYEIHGHNIPRSLQRLKKNSIDFLCECACIDGGQKDLSLKLIEHDRKILKKLPFEKYITINNGSFRVARGNKCWPTDSWVKLVKEVSKIGLPTVQIGIESDEYVTCAYDLRGKTTLYEAAAVIQKGLIHIDTEGGMVFIAKAVGKRSIVLFGPLYKEWFGFENNINIRTKEDICEPCCDQKGWYWTCHLGYKSCKAMETIKVEDVVQEIIKITGLNITN